MKPWIRRVPAALLGGGVGAAAMWWALHSISIGEVGALLRDVEGGFLLAAVLASGAYLYFKALRWHLLLPKSSSGMRHSMPAVAYGTAGNYLLPHVGELLRIWRFRRGSEDSAVLLLATIVVERVMDIATVLLFAVSILAFSNSPLIPDSVWILLVPMVLAALAMLVMLVRSPTRASHILNAVAGLLGHRARSWVETRIEQALTALQVLRNPRTCSALVSMSLLEWLAIVVVIGVSIRSVGMEVPIGLASVTVVVLLVCALVLPSAPGYVGTTQLAFVWALAPFSDDKAAATAASIVYNATTVGTTFVLAACSLAWDGGAALRRRFR